MLFNGGVITDEHKRAYSSFTENNMPPYPFWYGNSLFLGLTPLGNWFPAKPAAALVEKDPSWSGATTFKPRLFISDMDIESSILWMTFPWPPLNRDAY